MENFTLKESQSPGSVVDVYKTDHFVEVTEDVLETIQRLWACRIPYEPKDVSL